ncbi:hypothetical protein BJ875DRAFT_468458 [Amylocarpus encephaloides]|uniref:Secreted protein n=1 Tax=Amylocarpus encephaloides TaxID=45428 RepID=A0A9P8C380_9HELO|nr:hypothetical protein BJ875DRAFT_468458 [Amylocarpus encephaloides]
MPNRLVVWSLTFFFLTSPATWLSRDLPCILPYGGTEYYLIFHAACLYQTFDDFVPLWYLSMFITNKFTGETKVSVVDLH